MSKLPSLAAFYLRAGLSIFKSPYLPQGVTSLPEQTLSVSLPRIDPTHVQSFVDMVGGKLTFPTQLPSTYCQVQTMVMPMTFLARTNLRIIGALHEATEIRSFRPIDVKEKLSAVAHFDGCVNLSDKNDLLLSVSVDIFGEADPSTPTQQNVNNYRILNPKRSQITVEKKESVPEFYNGWQTFDYNYPITTGRDYAMLNGDTNPIHMHPLAAKPFGFSSCIPHGMFSVCKMAAEHTDTGFGLVSGKFIRPILLPRQVQGKFDPSTGKYVLGYHNIEGVFVVAVEGLIKSSSSIRDYKPHHAN
ncbi:hypothetical protein ScalyP_jg7804 [Parmales sp. scaly parma]|nr:hypothetical protein ScalyP_jg7804 [Parmales sp. scaly parma]